MTGGFFLVAGLIVLAFVIAYTKRDKLFKKDFQSFIDEDRKKRNIDNQKVIPKEQLKDYVPIDKLPPEAKRLTEKLMTYAEYKKDFNDMDNPPPLGNKRNVWVIRTYFPAAKDTKKKKRRKGVVIDIFDAHSGVLLMNSVQTEAVD